MKRHSLMAVFMVFVLCLSMFLAGCGNKAEEVPLTMELAAENTANALCRDNTPAVLKDMEEKKVITASVDGMFTNVLNMDLANTGFYDQLSLNVEGMTINANLYCDGESLAVTAPELLGDQALGINFTTLLQDLKTSGLLEMLDGESDGSMSALMQMIPMMKNLFEENSSEEAVKKVTDTLTKALEGVEETKSEGTVTVNGEEVKAVLFTYNMDKDDFKKLVEACMQIAEESYTKTVDAMVAAGVITEEELAENPYDEVRKEMESNFEKLGVDCITTFAVNPDNRCIMRMDTTFKGNSEDGKLDADLELVLGKDPAESEEITMAITGDSNDVKMDMNLTLSSTTEGAVDTTALVFEGEVDGDPHSMNVTNVYDNDSNAYTLTLKVDEEVFGAKGTVDSTDTKLTFTLDEIDDNGETTPVGLTVTVEDAPDCEIPAVPAYINILTETDLPGMMSMFGGSFEDSGDMEDYEDMEGWEDYEDYEDWEDLEDLEGYEDLTEGVEPTSEEAPLPVE